jgi:hypothetical protein
LKHAQLRFLGPLHCWGLLGLLGVLALPLVGCGAEREEAQKVDAALDHMRDTRGDARLPLLTELEGMEIKGEVAKAARDTCVQSYRALADANTETAKATARIKAIKATGKHPTAADLEALTTGTKLLRKATNGALACRETVVALKQWLKSR